jgi:hypothetical protein
MAFFSSSLFGRFVSTEKKLVSENYVMFLDKDGLTYDPCIASPIAQVRDTFVSSVTLEQATSDVTVATASSVPSQSN